jgi:hypothetical protein
MPPGKKLISLGTAIAKLHWFNPKTQDIQVARITEWSGFRSNDLINRINTREPQTHLFYDAANTSLPNDDYSIPLQRRGEIAMPPKSILPKQQPDLTLNPPKRLIDLE